MAFVKIRGSQIQDGAIVNSHIASNAAIAETKLDIAWENHYHNALKAKKVVDFVQVNAQSVASGSSILDVTTLLSGNTSTLSDPLSAEGVITDGPKNFVPVRDDVTGDPITVLDANNVAKEVYGRMTYTPADNTLATPTPEKWEVKFFYKDATNTEVGYAFSSNVVIDLQYAKRFNLDVVDEMFAANEKFVEAAADASAHLNIQQLAKDLYTSVSLDRDGNANLATPLQTQITDEVARAKAAEQGLQAAIDQEILDRIAGDDSVRSEFKLADEIHMKETGSVGVQSGGGVTAQATPNMTVAVGSSVVYNSEGKRFSVVAGNATITAADATNPRIDVVTIDNTGAIVVVAGTPGATPTAPTIPSTSVKLAEVSVPAGDTAIEGTQITDKRIYIATDAEVQKARATFVDLNARFEALEGGGSATGTEVETARTSDITGAHASLDARIEAGEARYEAVKTEVETARTSNVTATPTVYTSLDARLEAIEQAAINEGNSNDTKNAEQDTKISNLETYVSGESNKFHVHKKHVYVATGGETTVSMPTGETFQIGDDTLDVYVNGALQAKGHNYSETASGTDATKGIGVDFGTEQLAAGDIIVLKYQNNNATKTFA